MNKFQYIITFMTVCLALTSCGQTMKTDKKSETYKALAKLISFEGGDKIHFAKFQLIKDLSDSLVLSDTITVGYYNYRQPENNIDYVLLTLKKYDLQTTRKNYFICPDYDGKAGIQKAKIDFIDADYWEGCETDNGDCNTLNFIRQKTVKNWFLIMPCGGTETVISISGQNFAKELHFNPNTCPPYFDLSKLKDGNYSASMMSCGLGGTVKFNLTTIK